jgi:DNA-binding IclR family transcriptional regulator
MAETSAGHATSLVKALRLLCALEASPQGRGVTEVAREMDLPKSAVHRMLVTLRDYGFVQQSPEHGRYTLGTVLARLGLRAAEMLTPRVVARPYLDELAQEVHETVLLGVLAQDQVMIVEKVEHAQGVRPAPPLGAALPVLQTALGKLLLACSTSTAQERVVEGEGLAARRIRQELATIGQQGWAISAGEWAEEVCCLAVPIRQRRGDVVAALAMMLPRGRVPQSPRHDPFAGGGPVEHILTLLQPLRQAAARIEAVLP